MFSVEFALGIPRCRDHDGKVAEHADQQRLWMIAGTLGVSVAVF